MEKLRQEIEFVIFLMGGDCSDEIHEELRKHLSELLCMARNELQCVLTEESWAKTNKGIDSNEKPASAIVEPYKSVRIGGDEIKQPLTIEELKAGGWWCGEVTYDSLQSFLKAGIEPWGDYFHDWTRGEYSSTGFDSEGDLVVWSEQKTHAGKQIHRIGNEFFWGAPSC